MEIKNITREGEGKKKIIQMTVRITKDDSIFLKENLISPQKLFDESLKEVKLELEKLK